MGEAVTSPFLHGHGPPCLIVWRNVRTMCMSVLDFADGIPDSRGLRGDAVPVFLCRIWHGGMDAHAYAYGAHFGTSKKKLLTSVFYVL